ncbi:cellulose binding domain-containing protein [Dactylosporangium sp. NPDC005572]|uniref:cellulose binding domain-containing protein n=1 Tax=Dactylosporangium sp. NPDC005572 TaxID=3156889 RepID=UPI0033B1698D
MGKTPRRWFAVLVAVLAAAAGAVVVLAGPQPAGAATAFVQRCGIRFCLNGKPFYFAGTNTYDVFTYGSGSGDTETQYMDKAKIDAHLANLAADNVTVLRLWMFSHESWHGFETAKGVYNEQQFAQFDYVIESARAHNIRLIPVFENYWEAYGGIDTRLQWEGLSGGQPARGQFFNKQKCPGCFTSYKNYVSYALNRTNHYSGVKYKDDPTIMAWELMNEPRYENQTPNENTSGTTLRAWVDEMGAFVKGIDPNHLLGTGLEGHESRYGFGGDEGNPFVHIHQSPYVDFTSAHPYPTESWANLGIAQTRTLIRAWITDSHDLVGKPFFMGEFNVHNVDRSAWFTALFADFEAAGGDGSAFWWYAATNVDGKFGVLKGAPELAAFRAHSANMIAKSGGVLPSVSVSPSASPSVSPSVSPSASRSPGACRVRYELSDWGSSFNANVTITNNGTSAVNGWSLVWSFPGNQTINSIWNARATQAGRQVTATNESWSASIPAGGSVNFGLNGNSTTGTNGVPAAFTLNGTTCGTA